MIKPFSPINQPPFTYPMNLFENIEQWLEFENNPQEAQAALDRVKATYGPAIDPSVYETAQKMINSYNERVFRDKSQRPSN